MGCYAVASTMSQKFCVPLETVGTGERVECVIEGYIPGVSVGASGKVSTAAFCTFVKGDLVFMTDTGHLLTGGATWTTPYWMAATTAAGTTQKVTVGIALSSGATVTVDMWWVKTAPMGEHETS